MENYLSPKQVALAIGVSEASVKRWCDQGLIKTSRTGGGHRRLARPDVLHFLRQDRMTIVRPNLLGLPSMTGKTEATTATVITELQEALVAGDRERVRTLVLNYYMSGKSAMETCDQVIAPAFHQLGDRWQCGDVEIFEERRGCEIAMSTLRELESLVMEPLGTRPLALCATPKGDRYEIPLTTVAVTLREAGCRVEKVGIDLEAFVLEKAIEKTNADLICLSVSHIENFEDFRRDLEELHTKTKKNKCTLTIGGRALTDETRKSISYDVFCDDLAHLSTFVSTLTSAPSKKQSPNE